MLWSLIIEDPGHPRSQDTEQTRSFVMLVGWENQFCKQGAGYILYWIYWVIQIVWMPASAALHAVITGFYSLPGQFEVNLKFGSFFWLWSNYVCRCHDIKQDPLPSSLIVINSDSPHLTYPICLSCTAAPILRADQCYLGQHQITSPPKSRLWVHTGRVTGYLHKVIPDLDS